MDDLFGVDTGIDRRVDLQDVSVLADYVSHAAVEAENRDAVVGAVGARDTAVGVEQERKRQTVLFDECLVRFGRINTASEHPDTGSLETRVAVAERARLLGASGRVVLGIKVEHQLVAMEVGEADRCDLVAVDHLAMEIRRRRSHGEHRRARDSRTKDDRSQARDREHDRHHHNEPHRRPPCLSCGSAAGARAPAPRARRSAASRGSARRGHAGRCGKLPAP